jgi:peptidoglycan hydrolase-like protein with peptidoglycan-binding domain
MAVVLTTVVAIAVPASASAAVFGTRTIATGSTGSDVKTAQILLQRTGADITADGSYGPATAKAVKAFEKTNALAVDGKLEPTDAPVLRTKAAAAQGRATEDGSSDPDTPTITPPTTATPTTPPTTTTPGTTTDPAIGGATPTDPVGVVGEKAILNADGTATAPASAPVVVQQIIAAGNEIATKPYRYGGGHGKWKDTGYDCSGSVSYALHGAGLLDESMPSGNFETWGLPGKGTWVTLYSRGDHMYMYVAGLRFDTSGAKPSRWQTATRSSSGFTVTHPDGL